MLSILIPTYNYNITKLVSELHRQAIEQLIEFEIIVMEDGSDKLTDFNHSVCELSNCKQIVLKKNIGRSATRNKLADMAIHEHLLFMDCDAEVCSNQFIERYLSFCHEECIVIGGTAYDTKETNPEYSLRLKYGRKREARNAMERGKNNFATFNFLISKTIFNQVRFDETIRGYGHEDMLFGHQLHQLGYEFIQIDNPLIHKGLDSNRLFIKKTEEATLNLYLLHKTGRYPFLAQESKLLSSFLQLNRLGLKGLLAFKFRVINQLLNNQLCKQNPSLALYDLYKLLYLCETSRTK